MGQVIRSWRSLKDASIDSGAYGTRLKLTWIVESIVREPGPKVIGGGDTGTQDRRVSRETTQFVPWNKAVYDAHHVADRPLSEEQVAELLGTVA